MISFIVF